MDAQLRIVTRLPLDELWEPDGAVSPAVRGRDLGVEDVRVLLGEGPVQFVVADVGGPLRWVGLDDRFEFWKAEAAPHVADPAVAGQRLESFPGGFLFWASVWTVPGADRDAGTGGPAIIVLERAH